MNIEILINRSGIYGGIKRLYQVGSYLEEKGCNVVVNSKDGRNNSWFEHRIKENIRIIPDIRICAETCRELSPSAINILYQQAQFDIPEPEEPFDRIITTSNYLSTVLSNNGVKPTHIIPYGIDSTIFIPDSARQEQLTIGYMPRKNKEEFDLIKQLGGSDFKKYTFLEIDGLSQSEVIRNLQRCNIFLALSKDEGWGLPPFEASLCGCLIIGYHGKGGKDWLTQRTCLLTSCPQEFPQAIISGVEGHHEDKRLALQELIKSHLTVEKEKKAWFDVIDGIEIH